MTTLKHKRQAYDLYGDVERIKEALLEASEDVKGKTGEILSDSFDEIKKKKEEIEDGVSDYVSEKPFKALGISLLVGVAVGYFLHRP